MKEAAIEVVDVKKDFLKVTQNQKRFGIFPGKKEKINALKGVSLQVFPGEILGLLGPNGAGKTTLVKILTTIVLPDSGKASICGFNVVTQSDKARAHFGATIGGGERSTYWKLTGLENLVFFGRLYGLTKKDAIKRAKYLLERFDLTEKIYTRVENYSTGMKMKVNLARAIMPNPSVLLLDEPTLGMDPKFARNIRDFIKKELSREQEKTILLTTHYMNEADYLSDRIALINKGSIIREATADSLKAELATEEVIRIEVDSEDTREILENESFVKDVTLGRKNGHLEVIVRMAKTYSGKSLYRLLEVLREENIRPYRINTEEPSLEDVFLRLTEKEKGETKA